MALPLLIFGIAVVGVALFVWWLLVLIEALRTPMSQWEAGGQSQLLYVLLMVFLGVIGTILYIAVARPQLRLGGL
ncbi:MAG: hypothetical protein JWR35_2663 [Marmoricola sp.]|nr:hypothetical protein [Marmoricola sp.]